MQQQTSTNKPNQLKDISLFAWQAKKYQQSVRKDQVNHLIMKSQHQSH